MNAESPSEIGAIILAAGASTRLGRPKQLVSFLGRPLVRRVAEAALVIHGTPVVVVVGAAAAATSAALVGLPLIVAKNADWNRGMGGSVVVGMKALLSARPTLGAAILLVCDQPFLTAATIDCLVAAYRRSGAGIVASGYAGALGVPALFDHSLFGELLALPAQRGAKAIIDARRDRVVEVPFHDGAVDIDTPEDLAALDLIRHENPSAMTS